MNTPDGYHKSSYSGHSGDCVEVREGVTTSVRDTQNREAGRLVFKVQEWAALLRSLRTN